MGLLRTKDIQVGTLLAYSDPGNAGQPLVWGDPSYLALVEGDVVQVLAIETTSTTDWAKVQVVVVKGKRSGRTGYVSIDFGQRLQRAWHALTISGSMVPIRMPSGYQAKFVAPPVPAFNPKQVAKTVPAMRAVMTPKAKARKAAPQEERTSSVVALVTSKRASSQ